MHGQKSNSGIWYSIPFPGQTNGETTESSELTSHRANRSQLSVNRADMVARTKKYKYMFIRMESVWRQDWTEKRTKGCGSEAFTTNLILASFSQNPVCPGVLTTRQQQPPSSFFIVFIQGYENRENTQHFCLCVQYTEAFSPRLHADRFRARNWDYFGYSNVRKLSLHMLTPFTCQRYILQILNITDGIYHSSVVQYTSQDSLPQLTVNWRIVQVSPA